MEPRFVKEYIDFVDRESHGNTWNYLQVIEDGDTKLDFYDWIAAVTDFRLYGTLTAAFRQGGDLRTLRVANALNDSRSTTFGANSARMPAGAYLPIPSASAPAPARAKQPSQLHCAEPSSPAPTAPRAPAGPREGRAGGFSEFESKTRGAGLPPGD